MDTVLPVAMEILSTIQDVPNLSRQFGTKALVTRGGYSEVYLAEWIQPGTQASSVNVCYKVLRPPMRDMPAVVEQIRKTMKHLKREMKIWKDLDHENIVQFIGFAIEDRGAIPEAALVSEWCSNGDLVQYLHRNPSCNRLALLLDVARGLTYLHDRDPVVVHGDLKPSNVLISDTGHAKLCDFGFSLIADGLTTGFTSSGPGFTLRYCAPEVLESGKKTRPGDMYSFACTCAMILFNESPFPSITNDAHLWKAFESGQSPWDWKQSSPVEKILSGCCAVSPDARSTMREVFRSLMDTCAKPGSASIFEVSDPEIDLPLPPPLSDSSVNVFLTPDGGRTSLMLATSSKETTTQVDAKVAPVASLPEVHNVVSMQRQKQAELLPKATPGHLETRGQTAEPPSDTRSYPKQSPGHATALSKSSPSLDPNRIYQSNASPIWDSITSVQQSFDDSKSLSSLPSSIRSIDHLRATPGALSMHRPSVSPGVWLRNPTMGLDVRSPSKPVPPSSADEGGDRKKSFIGGIKTILQRLQRRSDSWVPSQPSFSSDRPKTTTHRREQSRENTPNASAQAIRERNAASHEQLGSTGDSYSSGTGSLPASVTSAAATSSHGETNMGVIKALLQTSAISLKPVLMPNLDQIPNMLLAWIKIYESVTSNVEDIEKLHFVIQQVQSSVLQPLQEWTGEIPPELESLTRGFYAALKKQVEEIKSVQRKNLLKEAIQTSDVIRQTIRMENCLNVAIYRSELRISTLILLRTERLSVQSELSRLKPVAAEYTYVKSKSECLEQTRVQIQASLLKYLKVPENRFTWLRGSPGTGKTAICMSVASTLNGQGTLAASFFWDKNQAATGLDSIEHFPSTLARQFAVFNEDFKMSLVKHLRHPSLDFVTSLPLDDQMNCLIIKPMYDMIEMLPSGTDRFVVVLDGLDECGNPEALKTLMELVLKLHDLPYSFAVLVSSRPETQVVRAWARARSMGHVIPCVDTDMIDKSDTFHTIRRMVHEGLTECISESSWKPSEKDLDAFTSACRELPVIASLRIREVCVQTERGATLKSEFDYFRDLLDTPTDLNSEYLRILRRAYMPDPLRVRRNVIENYRLVVGVIGGAREPLSLYSISQLLGITEDEVYATLRPISSIIDLPLTGRGQPRFYHATAKEFVMGEPIGDAGDLSFFINDKNGYFLGMLLLRFLRGVIERNDFMIPTNRPLGAEEKWKEFQKKERPDHVRYAVKHLFSHLDPLALFSQDSNELQEEFDHFLTQSLLSFIALSGGDFELPGELLRSDNHNSTQLLRETKRISKYVLHPCYGCRGEAKGYSLMGPVYSFDPWHIFRSMLPFTPTPSPLFKLYHHLLDPVRIFSISGEFAGHLIPLSKDSLNARKVMQAKLSNRRKVVDHRGLEIIDYKAEFLDPDIRKSIVSSAAISKDGHFIALGFGNGDIEVVDIDQQHAITRFQCNSRNPLAWIEFISGGHRIAVEDNEGNIFIFDNGMQPLKLGTLPSGCYPPVTEVADNGSFIVRLPRHLGSYWYDGVAILYLSGEPSICIFSTPGFIPVPARLPTIPCGLTLELSPGARYVVACDRKHAFIWSTESRKFIAHYDLPNFEAFVTGATTFRPYIATGTQHSEGSIPHIQGSGVECDLDKSWLESLSHKRLYHFYSPAMGGAAKPKLYLNNTLKLILPIEYHPVPNRPEGWYGDRVIWVEDFIYFPRASEDGTRLLVQGGMKAPIVVDIGQIA